MNETALRSDARAIWDAAVAAANPSRLVQEALSGSLFTELAAAPRVLVVGGGKAASAMALALEQASNELLSNVEGIVNIPAGTELPTQRIALHVARPAGSNQPTADGVAGAERMLQMVANARPDDIVICLLSGGGSALLPAPAEGVSLEDKQAITMQLHSCGATIDEMNAVRKHLSRIKGGRLAQTFRGRRLVSLIISDVVGDPLDVIASGPTAPDPTTFADALNVLSRYQLIDQTPKSVIKHLEAGAAGQIAETPKTLPANVENRIIGSNALSLRAARMEAERRGYRVLNLGSFIEGETRHVATAIAGVVRSIRAASEPFAPPACILFGGETTVTLEPNSGKGGRNQEFVLAAFAKLGPGGMQGVAILSGGTDGEDGPTDAAGALVSEASCVRVRQAGLSVAGHLDRHDAYPLFAATGDLIKTGLTNTNVMDVRVVLVSGEK